MNETTELKSKSQKKREASAWQDLGVKLVELNAMQLAQIPLSAPLQEAIVAAKTMKSHGAVRRQAMWIGKLIRMEDSDAIMQAYQHLHEEESAKTHGFHQVEEWRTRLMQDGKEALTLFIHAYPDVDVQQLRHLIKKAIEDVQRDAQTGAYRALFRYLRSFVS